MWTSLVLRQLNFRHYTTRSCLVISVKTIVNFFPLKKSYLQTLNQYLNNILNGHSIQFLELSVQNTEENITSRAAIFRLERGENSAWFSTACDVTFCWMILTQKFAESLAPPLAQAHNPILYHAVTMGSLKPPLKFFFLSFFSSFLAAY